MIWLRQLADNAQPGSLAARLRRARFDYFRQLLDRMPRPIRLLDLGGSALYWQLMGWTPTPDISITLLNLDSEALSADFDVVLADARDLSRFRDREFDVVFSNSLIEHVGSFDDQARLASEVMRVGTHYFIQTPNRYFPLEPHFLVPLFQFLPLGVKLAIVERFNIHTVAMPTKKAQSEQARAIRLLSANEMRRLFPGCTLFRERFFGVTKSLTAIGGWPTQPSRAALRNST